MIGYKLSDLIDKSVLQDVQESFSQLTGMGCVIVTPDGDSFTEKGCFSKFCASNIQTSETAKKCCALCHKNAILESLKKGKTMAYYCHSRLIEFAAPITAGRYFLGGIVSGQLKAIPKSEIKKISAIITRFASTISNMAVKNYERLEKTQTQEKTARSQTLLATDMALKMRQSMQKWLFSLKSAANLELSKPAKDAIRKIVASGNETSIEISDIVDYIKLTEGATNLSESEYDIRNLLPQTVENLEKSLIGKDISIICEVDQSVPKRLFGDYGRISKIIWNLVQESVSRMEVGYIKVKASCSDSSYAKMLEITVADSASAFSRQEIENIRHYFKTGISALLESGVKKGLSYPMVSMLLKQLSGTIGIKLGKNKNTVFQFNIPQLSIDQTGKRA